jgi:hypothetical protein
VLSGGRKLGKYSQEEKKKRTRRNFDPLQSTYKQRLQPSVPSLLPQPPWQYTQFISLQLHSSQSASLVHSIQGSASAPPQLPQPAPPTTHRSTVYSSTVYNSPTAYSPSSHSLHSLQPLSPSAPQLPWQHTVYGTVYSHTVYAVYSPQSAITKYINKIPAVSQHHKATLCTTAPQLHSYTQPIASYTVYTATLCHYVKP